MKRFQVVKASHIAFVAAAAVLLAVIIALAVRQVRTGEAHPTGTQRSSLAQEAAQAAFSASAVEFEVVEEGAEMPLFIPEDEHTDASAEAPAPRLKPSVLIYHTHTHEAYQPASGSEYVESYDRWRTADVNNNVVRVGDALAEALEAQGMHVVHDVTDHEQDAFETAYERSLETLQQYGDMEFDLYIDLHRDAYGTDPKDAVTVSVGQQRTAKVMLLVGTGDGFAVKPDSVGNYAFALQLTDRINRIVPGLCRDVMVKSKRYNQHMGRCILLEVGHNLNTLEEALAAVPFCAQAISDLLTEAQTEVVTLQAQP